jgi:hypothetical protein
MLDGTLTSFGDYDECLYLKSRDVSPAFVGKYCSIEMSLELDGKQSAENISRLMKERIPVFGSSNLLLGLCLPSLCSNHEIEKLIKTSGYNNDIYFL